MFTVTADWLGAEHAETRPRLLDIDDEGAQSP